jgi:hypothetical protein
MSERKPADTDSKETRTTRREDLADEVTAADDTGMISNEAEIARIEMEEGFK